MTESERATASGRPSGCALRRMAKLVRCVHSHAVCVELESLSFLTQPSVSHLPLTSRLSLCLWCVCVGGGGVHMCTGIPLVHLLLTGRL